MCVRLRLNSRLWDILRSITSGTIQLVKAYFSLSEWIFEHVPESSPSWSLSRFHQNINSVLESKVIRTLFNPMCCTKPLVLVASIAFELSIILCADVNYGNGKNGRWNIMR